MKVRLLTEAAKEGSEETQLAERIRFRKLMAMGMLKSRSYIQCFKLLISSKELFQGDCQWVWIYLNELYTKIPRQLFAKKLYEKL
jgi:hypothetical protein